MKKKKESQRGRLLATCLVLFSLIGMAGFLIRFGQKPLVAEEVEKAVGIPLVVDLLEDTGKRPHIKRKIKQIVVHNTANPKSTARNERDFLSNPTNTSSTSWHIAVDDQEMVQAIPVTEVAFHAGKKEGNYFGIGIEICESGDYKKAEQNAQKLIAYLMKTYHLKIEDIKTHQAFTGKECPRLILEHWDDFLEGVKEQYKVIK
ncbi:hypothetical protein CS063_01315 [Sporanaerobium hydrogeniformans]|uniref:Uncharacterized protein n=1 Tax=Sporanaerobium hydrogeniformans TaxID=3072179 RepID=A0AC61DFZ5_9FIRM|nr:N-acetylmuramoyl-L-alanine amidase [Sporanaerobium hydrogeniformans]PHV72144.1 hypothetical protein CS063_01315 [Sporanaerobium hydrogeniformans]